MTYNNNNNLNLQQQQRHYDQHIYEGEGREGERRAGLETWMSPGMFFFPLGPKSIHYVFLKTILVISETDPKFFNKGISK